MKNSTQMTNHRNLVRHAFEEFGERLVQCALDLYDPKSPAFFRSQLKQSPGQVSFKSLFSALSDRVARHDADKAGIIRSFEAEGVSAATKRRLSHLYALHDINYDHHAACWVRNLNTLQVASFIEHLLDHAAVNLAAGHKPFDINWLRGCGPFFAKRQHTPAGDMNDVEVLFNITNEEVRHAISSAAKVYSRWVDLFAPTLSAINGGWRG